MVERGKVVTKIFQICEQEILNFEFRGRDCSIFRGTVQTLRERSCVSYRKYPGERKKEGSGKSGAATTNI